MYCPFCRKEIPDSSSKCEHCGYHGKFLNPDLSESQTQPTPTDQAQQPTEQAQSLSIEEQMQPSPPTPSEQSQPLSIEEQMQPSPPTPSEQAQPLSIEEQLSKADKSSIKSAKMFSQKSFFDIEHLKYLFFSPRGRINRKRYWLGAILLIVVYLVPFAFLLLLSPDNLSLPFFLLFFIFWALYMYMILMLALKRLHDRNRHGAFIILLLIPIINLWPTIEILFLRGASGENRYGPDPLS
jgi:uncharacterized membrane protein YhaH (DUF805 family)